MGEEAFADHRAAIHNPATVHGMIKNYRAGLGTDLAHDEADRLAGRRVRGPTLVLWSKRDDMEALCGDVLAVWRPRTTELAWHGTDCGHHVAEEAPRKLAAAPLTFLAQRASWPPRVSTALRRPAGKERMVRHA